MALSMGACLCTGPQKVGVAQEMSGKELFRAGQRSLPYPELYLQDLARRMPTELILHNAIYPASQSSNHPPIPKLLKTSTGHLCPTLPHSPHPCLLCTWNPCEFLSQRPLGHLSPCMPLLSISEKPEFDFSSQLLSWQHSPHTTIPPSWPAGCSPTSPAPPPRPAPGRTRLAAGSLPAGSASLLSSLFLQASLPPPSSARPWGRDRANRGEGGRTVRRGSRLEPWAPRWCSIQAECPSTLGPGFVWAGVVPRAGRYLRHTRGAPILHQDPPPLGCSEPPSSTRI